MKIIQKFRQIKRDKITLYCTLNQLNKMVKAGLNAFKNMNKDLISIRSNWNFTLDS